MAQLPDGQQWPPPQETLVAAMAAGKEQPASAYIHVPFCQVRCGYCDFNTYTAQFGPGANHSTFAQSILQEIAWAQQVLRQADATPPPFATVFVGGGTPTLLDPTSLVVMIDGLRDTFGINAGGEITVEANPETVTPQVAQTLAAGGVTRLSMGMQSAVPSVLKTLERLHRPQTVAPAVAAAREAGLAVSLDLIYGTPGESIDDWETSLRAALALKPDHVSAYSLIVEEGTRMGAQVRRGELPTPSDDDAADKYELADQLLGAAGFRWYEISNFARVQPNEQDTPAHCLANASRHNLAYWQDWNWWGFGPGAHSHWGDARWWNTKHPNAYAQRLQTGADPAWEGEILTPEDRQLEQLMLRLRTSGGVPAAPYEDKVPGLSSDGLIEPNQAREGRIVLTLAGRLMADTVTRVLAGWEN